MTTQSITPRHNREQLARDAFWGIYPVLADEVLWRMGYEWDGIRRPACGGTLAEFIQVVATMTDEELDEILAIYAGVIQ